MNENDDFFFFPQYSLLMNCSICGGLHDDGGFYTINSEGKERKYFVCLDCGDNNTKEEILNILSHNETERGMR